MPLGPFPPGDARPITLEELDGWSAFERVRSALSLLLREQLQSRRRTARLRASPEGPTGGAR